MNTLAIAILWLAIQGALLLAVGAGCYYRAVRRGPHAAAWMAAFVLGVAVLVSPLSFCPLPSWCPAHSTVGSDEFHNGSERTTAFAAPSGHEGVSQRVDSQGLAIPWHSIGERLRQVMPYPESHDQSWLIFVPVTFMLGALPSFLYVLLGLVSVERLRRRSQLVFDPKLRAAVAALSPDARPFVNMEFRESPDIGSAATIGWHRPVILLPVDWHTWSELELRAVLAHELAHIRRRDYLVWLVARLSVALHFHNPLAHWLANRLQLQQELAADADGARCVGGARAYLQAVARLALRQDRWLRCWPARAFLAGHGNWNRRIAMLQTEKNITDLQWSAGRRWSVGIILLASACGLGALRGLAEPPKGGDDTKNSKPVAPQQASSDQLKRPKFEFSYLPARFNGVYGFRPAVFCRHPDIQPYMAEFNRLMATQLAPVLGLQGEFDFKLEDIEQMTGIVEIKRMPDGTDALLTSLSMLRMVNDYDWSKRIKAWLPGVAVLQHQGRDYFKAPRSVLAVLGMGPEVCALVPDGRTLVIGDETFIKQSIENLGLPRATPEWMHNLGDLEASWLVVELDNRDFHLVHDINKEGKPPIALTPICQRATSILLALDGSGSPTVAPEVNGELTSQRKLNSNLIITGATFCADEPAAVEVEKTLHSLFQSARNWANSLPAAPDGDVATRPASVLRDLLSPQIKRNSAAVLITACSNRSLLELKDAFDALEVHAEAKGK